MVSSTASRLPILTRGIVELALSRRRYEPMFLVDLAVPRDIEPTIAELDDAYLYTVDDLESVVSANLRLREDAAAQAEEMVHLQVQDYMDWLQVQVRAPPSRSIAPAARRCSTNSWRVPAAPRAQGRPTRCSAVRAHAHQQVAHHPTSAAPRAGP